MLTTVEGTYDNGRIELREAPPGVRHARVLVTFIDTDVPMRAGSFEDAVATFRARWAPLVSDSDAFAREKADDVSREEDRHGR